MLIISSLFRHLYVYHLFCTVAVRCGAVRCIAIRSGICAFFLIFVCDASAQTLLGSEPFVWWNTWWAYTLSTLLLIVMLFLTIRISMNRMTKRAMQLEGIVDQRTEEIQKQKITIENLLNTKDRVFANISHELRTPLTLILGPVEELIASKLSDRQSRHLNIIQRNSYSLLRLVDQMLELSRLQKFEVANSQEFVVTEDTDAEHFARMIVDSFDPLAKSRKLTIDLQVEPKIYPRVCNDGFEKILVNLLSNAIKYTPHGGQIKVKIAWCESEQKSVLQVSDTGVGIAKEKQDYIFERFSRLDVNGHSKESGAGIGLALLKELIESLKGSISVESEQGMGSTFTVVLPGRKGGSAFSQDKAEGGMRFPKTLDDLFATQLELNYLETDFAQALRLSKQKITLNGTQESDLPEQCLILIIDDNAEMRQYLQGIFSQDYLCMPAKNGQEGILIAQDQIPDLIICDVMMPEKDGFSVCNELKEDEKTSHIPIILLTALADRDNRLKGLLEKADDYITKPFDKAELKLRIENLLSLREMLKHRFSSQISQHLVNDKPIFDEHDDKLINPKDIKFIERLETILDEFYRQAGVSVNDLADQMFITRRQLHRKVKALTGYTPVDYIKIYRIQKAAKLLVEGLSVDQVSFECGFSSRNYFSNCFKAHMGISPKQYSSTKRADGISSKS